MRRIVTLAFLGAGLLAGVRSSVAQEAPVVVGHRGATHGIGLGVGAEGMLFGGPSGLSVAYDAGPWHIDTLLGLEKLGGVRSTFNLGGRFWYHLHNTANADFSVGGGLGYRHSPAGAGSADSLYIELGAQLRAFLTSNVALSASLGLSIATVDAEGYGIGGQVFSGQEPFGGAGIGLHYYFY
jgi:hypothetical protein